MLVRTLASSDERNMPHGFQVLPVMPAADADTWSVDRVSAFCFIEKRGLPFRLLELRKANRIWLALRKAREDKAGFYAIGGNGGSFVKP